MIYIWDDSETDPIIRCTPDEMAIASRRGKNEVCHVEKKRRVAFPSTRMGLVLRVNKQLRVKPVRKLRYLITDCGVPLFGNFDVGKKNCYPIESFPNY